MSTIDDERVANIAKLEAETAHFELQGDLERWRLFFYATSVLTALIAAILGLAITFSK